MSYVFRPVSKTKDYIYSVMKSSYFEIVVADLSMHRCLLETSTTPNSVTLYYCASKRLEPSQSLQKRGYFTIVGTLVGASKLLN